MPYTKETILSQLEKRNLLHYENIEPIQSGIAFLTGQTTNAPVPASVEAAERLEIFTSLLQLPEQWDENDRLVLQLIATETAWPACKHAFLATIVPMLDMPGTSSSIVSRFSYFTSFLQQRGSTPEEIGSLLISYSGDGNNFDLAPLKFTPLRKFLQDLIKGAEKNVVEAYLRTWKQKGWNSLFYRLLIKGHPDFEMEYLESMLLTAGNLADQQLLARVLLQNNGIKYTPLLESAINNASKRTDHATVLYGYDQLAAHFPEKYQPLLLQAAYDYLDMPAVGRNEREHVPSVITGQWPAELLPAGVMAIREILQQQRSAGLLWLTDYLEAKRYLHPGTFQLLIDLLQEKAVPVLLKALNNDYDAKVILPVLTQLDKALYIDQLWPFTLHKLKSVRTLVAVILAEHPLALEKAAELLQHKKADQRLTAVQILCRLNHPAARDLLQQALHKEINDDTRDLMLETLGGYTITGESELDIVHQLVAYARKRNKLSKPVEKWLEESSLPPLYLFNGDIMPTDMLRFLLYRMSRAKDIRTDMEAKPILRLVDRNRSGEFAAHLFRLYNDQEGDTKLKYLLTLSALIGDELLADRLVTCIYDWIAAKRMKMAEQAVGALALHGSDKALRTVELLSRKYRVRKANIGAAALAAWQQAATEQGVSIHELGDRIIPNFGFNGLYKQVEVRNEIYRIYLDEHFKPAWLNEKGRRLKAIPTGASTTVKDVVKALGKEITETVKLQSPRLEHFLVIQRKWNATQWQQLFLQNPVMFVYATRLVWGLFDKEDQLITTFRCQEDGKLFTLADTSITLPTNSHIRILHPVYLDTDTLRRWKHKLNELSITPVFPQLERPVAALPPQQAYSTCVHDFEDISLESEVLNRHMEQKGWKLSDGCDSKYVYTWHKTDDEHQLEVIVEMSSSFQDNSMLLKLGKLYFIDKTKAPQRWLRSAEDTQDGLLPLKNVPPVFYSEAITDIAVSRVKASLP
ncbi:DUF4132 domain-containing protein [Chitinophaga sp. 30R24]|uniref:DUF4132 domain-containing protein n=1 Tax=Chitinophaga sp. 30R24 TaxID=3248838 RepID=UPI003B8FED72